MNAFGLTAFSPNELVEDQTLLWVLKPVFLRICNEIGLTPEQGLSLADSIWSSNLSESTEHFEARLRAEFGRVVDPARKKAAVEQRTVVVAHQITPYLAGDVLGDIGCGNGLVAWGVRNNFKRCHLTDPLDYRHPSVTLPFHLHKESATLTLPEPVDTTLLIAVLHHAQDPFRLLREVRALTRKRCIVIESVYGMTLYKGAPNSYLYQLDAERQRKYLTFVDWLFNRVFQDGVSCPYNFGTPEQWRRAFDEAGWEIYNEINLGVYQPVVPTHHYMFVLEPK